MHITRTCVLCAAPARDAREIQGIAGEPWVLRQCTACGFVYLENPPSYTALSDEFPWNETYEQESQTRRDLQARPERAVRRGLVALRGGFHSMTRRDKLKRLCARYLSHGSVLNLGCDIGYNLAALPAAATPIGIEIAEALVRRARPVFEARGGYVIRASVLEGLKQMDTRTCAGAIAKSYLEHEIRPREVLGQLQRVLVPGSPLIVKVPNYACWLRTWRGARWCGYRFPDHVNYFTPRSLRRLLEASGFVLVRFGCFDRLPTSDNMWCVAVSGATDRPPSPPRDSEAGPGKPLNTE